MFYSQMIENRLAALEQAHDRQRLEDILQRLVHLEQDFRSLLPGKKSLTLPEAAAYIGISRSHLYRLTSQGRVPHYKPRGKVLYFDRDELDRWNLRNSEPEPRN
jgi:excisionase family DNA binding protein